MSVDRGALRLVNKQDLDTAVDKLPDKLPDKLSESIKGSENSLRKDLYSMRKDMYSMRKDMCLLILGVQAASLIVYLYRDRR